MKNLKTFNELYQSTYRSAASKIGYNTERARKLRDHADKVGTYKTNKFYENLVFNIFTVMGWDKDSEEIFPDKVIKYKIDEYAERPDDPCFQFSLSSIDEDPFVHLWIYIIFDENGKINVDLGSYLKEPGKKYTEVRNLFADRKSMKNFMKVLETLYITDNPNVSRNAVAKINKTKVTEITHDEVEDYENFWKFLNSNNYDWNKFKSEIKINKLWDDLMPEKTNPQWTTDHT